MKNQYLIGLSKLRYMKINILLLRSSSSLFGENLNTRNVCGCGVGGGKIFISKFTGDSITSIKRRRGKIVFSWEKTHKKKKKKMKSWWKNIKKLHREFIKSLYRRHAMCKFVLYLNIAAESRRNWKIHDKKEEKWKTKTNIVLCSLMCVNFSHAWNFQQFFEIINFHLFPPQLMRKANKKGKNFAREWNKFCNFPAYEM